MSLENSGGGQAIKTPEKSVDDSIRGRVERELGVPQSKETLANGSVALQVKNAGGEYVNYIISEDGQFAQEVKVQEGKNYNKSDLKDIHYVSSSATVGEVERSGGTGNPLNLRAINQQLRDPELSLVKEYLGSLKVA